MVWFLLGNVCSTFSIWTHILQRNGRFWLSEGLEYLPSGIPGFALIASTLPTVDFSSAPTLQSIISWSWQWTVFLHQHRKPKPQSFMDFSFHKLWKSYQVWLVGQPATNVRMLVLVLLSTSWQVHCFLFGVDGWQLIALASVTFFFPLVFLSCL